MRWHRIRPGSAAVGLVIASVIAAGCVTKPAPHSPKPVPTLAGDPWAAPFLSRPASEPIRRVGDCDDIVIENLSFQDLGEDVEAIHLRGCANVTIRANDFARVAQAITVLDSTNVRVEWNRYLDITGPHARDGKHRANFVQLVNVTGGYIGHNKGKGGDTEDIISLFETGGTASDPLIVERNQFEGTDWTSSSGSGIALGDQGSMFTTARENTLLNVGQVGMFIAGGTNHKILDNVVYGEARPGSNVGIYVWNQADGTCADHEVSGNRVSWRAADGSANPAWDGGGCGEVAGWSTNDWDAEIDPESLRVQL